MMKSLYIPFDSAKLFVVEVNDEVYVAMRPIVQGMGLDWTTQLKELQKNFKKYGCTHMTAPTTSDEQEMLFMPIKKLNGWLFSIDAAKVRVDLRETVEHYQEECFVVLYEFWHKGKAIRDKVQAELDEWHEREKQSFKRSSEHGRKLNQRKQEKQFIAAKIKQCESNLIQPSLFESFTFSDI